MLPLVITSNALYNKLTFVFYSARNDPIINSLFFIFVTLYREVKFCIAYNCPWTSFNE